MSLYGNVGGLDDGSSDSNDEDENRYKSKIDIFQLKYFENDWNEKVFDDTRFKGKKYKDTEFFP